MANDERPAANVQSQKQTEVGNADSRLHESRKCWLSDGETTVCAVYGPGTSMSITANYKQPFEGLNPAQAGGGAGEMFGSALQAITGKTMITDVNTRNVWERNEPTEFTLEMQFYALRDPDKEVMQPLHVLENFIAPDTQAFFGVGNISKPLQLCIGRFCIYQFLVLKNMSLPFDKETDMKKRFVRATVTLDLATIAMISKDALKSGNGFQVNYESQ